jgi:hypothetical protein
VKILKVRKTDFPKFLLEMTIYFFAFIVTLFGYKLFFSINRFFFQEELYPSIVGIFSTTLVVIYMLFKVAIFAINKKRPGWEIENKIYSVPIKILDFINPTDQDFQKVITIFVTVNFIIIGMLLSGIPDAFSFKKRLYLGGEFRPDLLEKEKMVINNLSGNENFKYNIAKSIEFIRLTNPHYYELILDNTDNIAMSERKFSVALAEADFNTYTIVFDPKYGQKRYETIKEYLGIGMLLVHEAQHLKDFHMIDSGKGFSYLAYLGGGTYFKVVCNPITNYENFIQVMRATSTNYDEWCAQIEETKFFRMYNIDYKNFSEFGDLFTKQ